MNSDVRGRWPFARSARVAAVVTLLVATAWVVGCDSGTPGRATGEARYPRIESEVSTSPAGASTSATNRTDAMRRFGTSGQPVLWGLQSELGPGLLWHSTESRVSVFAGLERRGLGAPTFLAYSSPTGIAVLRPGSVMAGDQMRENWLLAGFAGASGWVEWDSPWALFLQRRPVQVGLASQGLRLEFEGAAGFWTMLPLYGAYRPPQQGKEMLEAQGLKKKGYQTWEWPLVVARDPLTRLRYWAGATRRFPLRRPGQVSVSGRRGTVTWEERFEWLEIPDEWSTRAVSLAPVSPALGLVLTQGQSFPVEFSKPPFDFELPTVYGPWFAVPDVDRYTMTFPVLRYVNETERIRPPSETAPGTPGGEAIEGLRAAGRALFASEPGYRPEGGDDWASLAALDGYLWQARILEFLEPGTRSNAVAVLRRAMWDRVLVPERFVDRLEPGPEGRPERGSESGVGRGVTWASALLQSAWAVADATGDRSRVRERWPLLKREWTRHAPPRWVGFGRGEMDSYGDGLAPAIAFARLAWLAGDLESYRFGCGDAAREWVSWHARMRGARWFREQQPWQPGVVIPEEARVGRLLEGSRGWEIVGGAGDTRPEAAVRDGRWARFWDGDVARLGRVHLAAELRREWSALGALSPVSGTETAGMAALRNLGFGPEAGAQRVTAPGSDPRRLAGVALLAHGLGRLRQLGRVEVERLIPDVDLEGPSPGFDTSREEPHLVVSVKGGAGGTPSWPGLRWIDWPTPTGEPWTVGEVRVGEGDSPAGILRIAGDHEVRWDVEGPGPRGSDR